MSESKIIMNSNIQERYSRGNYWS